MGFFKLSKEQLARKAEKKAFRRIVSKKETQAAREAFAKEAIKVAGERGRAKARRKGFGQILSERVSGSVKGKVSGTKRRTSTGKRRKRSVASRKRQVQNTSDLVKDIFG